MKIFPKRLSKISWICNIKNKNKSKFSQIFIFLTKNVEKNNYTQKWKGRLGKTRKKIERWGLSLVWMDENLNQTNKRQKESMYYPIWTNKNFNFNGWKTKGVGWKSIQMNENFNSMEER